MRKMNSPRGSGALMSERLSDWPNAGRSTATTRPSAENVSHVGRKASMLSGNGLRSRIGSLSFLLFAAKRIGRPSTVLNFIEPSLVLLSPAMKISLRSDRCERHFAKPPPRLDGPCAQRSSPHPQPKRPASHFPSGRLLLQTLRAHSSPASAAGVTAATQSAMFPTPDHIR